MSSKQAASQAKETSGTPDVLQKRFTTLTLDDNSVSSCDSFTNIPRRSVPGPLVCVPLQAPPFRRPSAGSRNRIPTPNFSAGSNNFIVEGNAALGREARGSSHQGVFFYPPNQAQTIPEGLRKFRPSPVINRRSVIDQPIPSDFLPSSVSRNGSVLKYINKIDQTYSNNQAIFEGEPGYSRDNEGGIIGRPQRGAATAGVSSLEYYISRRHPSSAGVVKASARLAGNHRFSPVSSRPRCIAESQVVPDDLMPPDEKLMYQRHVYTKLLRRIANQDPSLSQASIPIAVRSSSGGNSEESRAYAWDGRRSFLMKYFNR